MLLLIDAANGLEAAGVVVVNAAPNGFALGVEVGALNPPNVLEGNGATAVVFPNADEVTGVAGGTLPNNKLFVLNGAVLLLADVDEVTAGAVEPNIPEPVEEEAPKIEGVELVVDVEGAEEPLKAAAPNGFEAPDVVGNGAVAVVEEAVDPKRGVDVVTAGTVVELGAAGNVDPAVINGLLDTPLDDDVVVLLSVLVEAKGFNVVDGAPKPPNVVDAVLGWEVANAVDEDAVVLLLAPNNTLLSDLVTPNSEELAPPNGPDVERAVVVAGVVPNENPVVEDGLLSVTTLLIPAENKLLPLLLVVVLGAEKEGGGFTASTALFALAKEKDCLMSVFFDELSAAPVEFVLLNKLKDGLEVVSTGFASIAELPKDTEEDGAGVDVPNEKAGTVLIETSLEVVAELPKLNPPVLDEVRVNDEEVFLLLLSSSSASCLRLDLLELLFSSSSSAVVCLSEEDDDVVVPKFKGGIECFLAARTSSFPSLLTSPPKENLLDVVEVAALLLGFDVPKVKPLLLDSVDAGCAKVDVLPNVNVDDGFASAGGAEDVAPNSNFPAAAEIEGVGVTPPNVNPLVVDAGVVLISLLLAEPNENPPLPILPVVVVVLVPNWNLGGSDEDTEVLLVDDPELPPSNGLSHEAHLSRPFSFCTKHTLHLTLLETIFQMFVVLVPAVVSSFLVDAEVAESNAVSQETHLLAFLSL